MLLKKRSEPLSLLGLQSLINRLPTNHEQYSKIEEDLRKRKAGFGGELNFDKHINEFRPNYPFGLIHDICLLYNGIYFQMDSVLIQPDKIIIFEIKNLGGKLTVKASPTQFIQEIKGERKIIQSPIIELERKMIFMDRWLKERGLDCPIKGMIGLAYTNELFIEEEINTDILFTHEIPIRLYNMAATDEILSRNNIRNIARDIVDSHQEYNPFPLTKTLNIAKEDIIPGVICPECKLNGMKWFQKKWRCHGCTYQAADCHLPLIDDWFYIMDSGITNRQFRSFSGIQNQDVAKRILKKTGLVMKGRRRTAFYIR
ncbi:NERD domain-containing protein [Sporosarcina luteola]|uniref:nuclease-related domain-containing protein n=1 Tax=Sporosarcina luteola TaxID=582850 RepID=UPI00203BBA50|nr:nuclease-related domain-containing protein [Sporosarcina luteola]MCM3636466.1 NERD domain-containing protein [Sporosarcina luteola]